MCTKCFALTNIASYEMSAGPFTVKFTNISVIIVKLGINFGFNTDALRLELELKLFQCMVGSLSISHLRVDHFDFTSTNRNVPMTESKTVLVLMDSVSIACSQQDYQGSPRNEGSEGYTWTYGI